MEHLRMKKACDQLRQGGCCRYQIMEVKEKKAQVRSQLDANKPSGPTIVTSDPRRVICSVMTSHAPIIVQSYLETYFHIQMTLSYELVCPV